MTQPSARPHRALRALLVVLTCLGLGSASLAAAHGGAPADPAASVVTAARAHLGAPYAWGGTGPSAYDCSGLTSSVWTQAGHVAGMPRTAALQQAWAVPIPAEQALPGDLVFYGAPASHVGLISGRDHGALTLIDASASRKAVVERPVWFSGIVRFGRVPRPGMPPVRPWQPAPVGTPKPAPPAAPPADPVVATALVSPHDPALHGRPPLPGLPARPATGTAAMARFAGLARAQVGATTWTDTGLVTALWRRAGGAACADSRAALRACTHPVRVGQAEVGDLVVYAAPGDHVGVYVGGGLMVDASRALGRVVLRPVWAAPGVQLVRWAS